MVSEFNENDNQNKMNEKINQEEVEENGSKCNINVDKPEGDDLVPKCGKALDLSPGDSSSLQLEKDKVQLFSLSIFSLIVLLMTLQIF